MSKYSITHDGKVLDYKFVTREFDIVFLTGHIVQGQIFNMMGSYSAVPAMYAGIGPVNGFKTRIAAAEFILQSNRLMNNRISSSAKKNDFARNIEVTVSGISGSGKSTVATLISELLSRYGFAVSHEHGEDGQLQIGISSLEDRVESILPNTKISVNESHKRR